MDNYNKNINRQPNLEEFDFKDLVSKIKEWATYLKTQIWKLVIAVIIGGAIGFIYANMQPITYTSKTTFVVEDAKSTPSLGGLASLAGQFGVDVGSGVGGGLISGDNILLYFKSESLIREVLLSPWDKLGETSLADKYIKTHNLGGGETKGNNLNKITFPINSKGNLYTRTEDSILKVIINDHILNGQLSISKVDKKAGFIQLVITMNDEALAKVFCEKLVEIAIKRYVVLKTEKQQKTVDKLQARVDSISSLLNSKTYTSAKQQTFAATMDINPLFKTQTTVTNEMTTREKTLLSSVYVEIIKNLELAKFTLSQETPVIQIVDYDTFPLKKNKVSKKQFLLLGSIIMGLIVIIVLLGNRLLKSILL